MVTVLLAVLAAGAAGAAGYLWARLRATVRAATQAAQTGAQAERILIAAVKAGRSRITLTPAHLAAWQAFDVTTERRPDGSLTLRTVPKYPAPKSDRETDGEGDGTQ